MNKVELEIIAISHSVSQTHNYAVILGELEGSRRLPIVIGGFEAQGIAIAVERMTPNRPLTHDLFKATLDRFDITVKEVIINDLIDGIFHAQLICEQDGNISIIDSRTSDALAMAVRFRCPIYTYDTIMDQAGVEMEIDKPEPSKKSGKTNIQTMSLPDLEELLHNAIKDEDYEKAAMLRDEIKNRKDN